MNNKRMLITNIAVGGLVFFGGNLIKDTSYIYAAEKSEMHTVIASTLNIRKGPSTSQSVIGKVYKGDKVEVLSHSNEWAKIKLKNSIGYCSLDYLKRDQTAQLPTSSTNQKEATANVNMRKGAGTNYGVVLTIPKGKTVKVLSTSNGWNKVEYSGKIGYVSSIYLRVSSPTTVTQPPTAVTKPPTTNPPTSSITQKETTANVNMRKGAGTNYGVVLTIPKGKTVKVLSISNGWDKVEYSGKTGYVSSTYLRILTPTTVTPPPITNPGKNELIISVAKTAQEEKISIQSQSKISYENFYLTSPKRLVIDIKNTNLKGVKNISNTVVAGNVVKLYRASHTEKDNTVRVVVELNENYNTSKINIIQNEKELSISFNVENSSQPPIQSSEIYYSTADSLTVRKGPGIAYSSIGSIKKDSKAEVLEFKNGWAKINYNGSIGYCSESYLIRSKSTASINERLNTLMQIAKEQLGKPYKYGAAGPNEFDCSGLIIYAYQKTVGMNIPRTSQEQAKFGKTVKKEELKKGDLIFFNSTKNGVINHVGMYLENNEYIHAPSTGDVVKINKITEKYFEQNFVNAQRIMN